MPAKKKTITLETVYSKLLEHDKQFDNMTKHIFALEGTLRKEIETVAKRVAQIEEDLEKMTGDLETLTQEYRMVTVALKRLEQRLGDLPGEDRGPVQSEIDALNKRVSGLEQRVGLIESR
ncbi:MAG: hypothetical protein HY646_13880 [Acidobacteria bacterium]|nr:hypothetical protein [Acidobacteriota bacterium]